MDVMTGSGEVTTNGTHHSETNGVATTTVLVTGGAGYIGTTLVPILLQRGYDVTVYDNFRWGSAGLFHVSHLPNLHIIRGDICDKVNLKEAMKDKEFIYHLAGIVGFPACAKDPELAEAVNVQGTKNIVELLQPDQKIIFASTGSCYGAIDGICTESTPLNPITLYGKSKLEGEELCRAKGGVALRLATLFGVAPRLRMDLLLNNFTYMAFNGETIELYQSHFRRTFLHIKDAARAFLLALDRFDEMKGEAFNVGDEKMNMTKIQLANKVKEQLPDTCIVLGDSGEDLDKRDYEVSYKRIRGLGFNSTFTIDDGVRELVKVYTGMTDDDIKRAKNV